MYVRGASEERGVSGAPQWKGDAVLDYEGTRGVLVIPPQARGAPTKLPFTTPATPRMTSRANCVCICWSRWPVKA